MSLYVGGPFVGISRGSAQTVSTSSKERVPDFAPQMRPVRQVMVLVSLLRVKESFSYKTAATARAKIPEAQRPWRSRLLSWSKVILKKAKPAQQQRQKATIQEW